jgi:hypothetical protein
MLDFQEYTRRLSDGIFPELSFMAFDPGGTTGWVRFHKSRVVDYGQMDGTIANLYMLLEKNQDPIVIEWYRIYKHKIDQHINSDVPTLRLIGALQTFAYINRVPLISFMASEHKQVITDQKLRFWRFYIPGMPHTNDALRIGLYYIVSHYTRRS